jgi:hypothetical protein
VATSRPTASDLGWFRNLEFDEVFVNPLAESDKYRLIDHWHVAVGVATHSEPRKNATTGLRLRNLLEKDEQLSALASTPLLCSAICALHYNTKGHLPHRLNSLCEDLVRMLIDRRDKEGGVQSDQLTWELCKIRDMNGKE